MGGADVQPAPAKLNEGRVSAPPMRAALARAASIDDLRDLARRRVPRVAFDYMDGGAESEAGLARNRHAFEAITLTPRYLVDVARRSAATTLFGRRYSAPLGIAPTGLAGLVWPGADQALARQAHARHLPFVLSTPATVTIEAASAAAPGSVWFQLYVMNDRAITLDLMRRARVAGVEVLVVTVDIPAPAKRERDIRNRFTLPLRPSVRLACDIATHPAWAVAMATHGSPRFANLAPYAPPGKSGTQSLAAFMAAQISPSVTWDEVKWLRREWTGRLVIKGLMSVPDATSAVERGLDAVWISNHGGRQFDAAQATVDALPAIAAAVAGRVPVLVDSGIRRGLDIAKALTRGADFLFCGRATLYGAGAGGEAGIARALEILQSEFNTALGQLGCRSIEDLRGIVGQCPETRRLTSVERPVPGPPVTEGRNGSEDQSSEPRWSSVTERGGM